MEVSIKNRTRKMPVGGMTLRQTTLVFRSGPVETWRVVRSRQVGSLHGQRIGRTRHPRVKSPLRVDERGMYSTGIYHGIPAGFELYSSRPGQAELPNQMITSTPIAPLIESHTGYLNSPIGLVEIRGASTAVTSLDFVDDRRHKANPNRIVEHALRQVAEYFDGIRREFDLPLIMPGTAFQQAVWQHLLTLPYGCTTSYQEVARAIARPRAVRAVGAANGRNPISLIVPCHRVIGSDGRLTGYGGGLWRKRWLLQHEAADSAGNARITTLINSTDTGS